MGAHLTAFKNRSVVEMEIRVFSPETRPDRLPIIATIGPGETKELQTKSLCFKDPSCLMVFLGSKFTFFSSADLFGSAKIICDIDEGLFKVTLIKISLPGFRRLRGFSSCLKEKSRSVADGHPRLRCQF